MCMNHVYSILVFSIKLLNKRITRIQACFLPEEKKWGMRMSLKINDVPTDWTMVYSIAIWCLGGQQAVLNAQKNDSPVNVDNWSKSSYCRLFVVCIVDLLDNLRIYVHVFVSDISVLLFILVHCEH